MFDVDFNENRIFEIDGRMCGGKMMKNFRFVCNIILFEKCVVEIKKEKNENENEMRVKRAHNMI